MALTPTFLFDFESEMARITEFEFARISQEGNLWWREVAKVRNTGKKREIIGWLLSNARLYDGGKSGGNIQFDDMAAVTQEYDVRNADAGLRLQVNQVTDNDGDGFDFAEEWSANMGALFNWWPQSLMATLLLNGGTSNSGVAYDGSTFFNASPTGHPYNQRQTGLGGFANWFKGSSSGNYPGALPIDESVTADVALKNIGILIGYLGGIKMPNGVTPKFLRPRRIMCAPRLMPRVTQLTQSVGAAQLIAQAAASGGGGASVDQILKMWSFEKPIEVQEFAGATLADRNDITADLTWYLVCEEMMSTQLGGLVYVDRESFRITYYTGSGGGTGVDAVLDRARELEWHAQGRNVAGYGRPDTIFRVDPS